VSRPEDAAAVALAKRYAALIDEATPRSIYDKHLRTVAAALDPADEAAAESLVKITHALGAHSVASDLGPKLLAALAELRLTPRAWAAVVKGGAPDGRAGKSALDQLRERRGRRADGPAAVDPPAG
jgi:hypothetical protein